MQKTRGKVLWAAASGVMLVVVWSVLWAQVTVRVSLSTTGEEGNGPSLAASINADGSVVAFESLADNFTPKVLITPPGGGSPTEAPGDTNMAPDIFIRSIFSGETIRVSVSANGGDSNAGSESPAISADGRFVAFASSASNLILRDRNGFPDVFVRDLRLGKTFRVSIGIASAEANGGSFSPSISADGRLVAFASEASNLVEGDTNGALDVFVHNLKTRKTVRASISSAGRQSNADSLSPAISADGRFVAFVSFATNLVEGDTNDEPDIFVHDLTTRKTVRVSVSSDGKQANGPSNAPSISSDGRVVAFESAASNLVFGDDSITDIFVHELSTGKTEKVSIGIEGRRANNASFSPTLSGDGRFVAFQSFASNLVTGDLNRSADIFVHDRFTNETVRVSVTADGKEANDLSGLPSLSLDGRMVAFTSVASNLVAEDKNKVADVFLVNNPLLGLALEPEIVVSPFRLNFRRVVVGTSKTKNLTISNDGRRDLTVNSVTSSDAQFVVLSPDFPKTIAPGRKVTVQVQFTPTAVGRQRATLTVASDDPDLPEVTVSMVGQGIEAEEGD